MMTELKQNPRAKGLIFDIDGTICDTMPVHFIAWRQTAAEQGIEFTPELFLEVTGIPALQTSQYLKDKFSANFDVIEFTRLKEERFEQNMHKAKPIMPVVKIIRENKGKLPMACGTGGSQYLAWKTLEIAGVKDCFEHVVAAEDVINHKPFPDTFLKAAELIGVSPSDCEVFEDGQLGLQAAESAGMMSVDVTPYYEITIGQEV
ncbi:MAG TPA: HAD-IA family hydrolase [Prolixibacteraceae bacterium]|jgi:beta-phosphoglucomutase family hydrolase